MFVPREQKELLRELTELVRDLRSAVRTVPGVASILPLVVPLLSKLQANKGESLGTAIAEGVGAMLQARQAPGPSPHAPAASAEQDVSPRLPNGVNLR